MNKQELMEKVKALMASEEFKAKLEAANDLDEMEAAFQAEGIAVTGAELDSLTANRDGEELSEESLDEVAGGIHPIVGLAIIAFVGGSLLMGYIDGVKKKGKTCGWF